MNWNVLEHISDVDALVNLSQSVPCVIFKHSIRCNISHIAKSRLETRWNFSKDEVEPFYLDLIQYRTVSNHIAERFAVHHESPQVLLIHQGECTYESSHLDISVDELRENMPFHRI